MTQIVSGLFVLAMIIFIFPRMKHAIKNSPKGTMQDWMAYIIPIIGVILFVILLAKSV